MKTLVLIVLCVGMLAACQDKPPNECDELLGMHNAIVDEMNELVDWQSEQLDAYDAGFSDELPAEVKAEWDAKQDVWDDLDSRLQDIDSRAFALGCQ